MCWQHLESWAHSGTERRRGCSGLCSGPWCARWNEVGFGCGGISRYVDQGSTEPLEAWRWASDRMRSNYSSTSMWILTSISILRAVVEIDQAYGRLLESKQDSYIPVLVTPNHITTCKYLAISPQHKG